jgi:hypothetical protein
MECLTIPCDAQEGTDDQSIDIWYLDFGADVRVFGGDCHDGSGGTRRGRSERRSPPTQKGRMITEEKREGEEEVQIRIYW